MELKPDDEQADGHQAAVVGDLEVLVVRLPQQPLEGGDEGAELGVDAVAEQRGVRQDGDGGVPQLGAPRHGDRLAQQPLDLRGEVGLHPGDDDQERDGDAQDGRNFMC